MCVLLFHIHISYNYICIYYIILSYNVPHIVYIMYIYHIHICVMCVCASAQACMSTKICAHGPSLGDTLHSTRDCKCTVVIAQ